VRPQILAPGDIGEQKEGGGGGGGLQLPGYAGYRGAWRPAHETHAANELDAAEEGRHGPIAAAAAKAAKRIGTKGRGTMYALCFAREADFGSASMFQCQANSARLPLPPRQPK